MKSHLDQWRPWVGLGGGGQNRNCWQKIPTKQTFYEKTSFKQIRPPPHFLIHLFY